MKFIYGEQAELETQVARIISDRLSNVDRLVLGVVGGRSILGIFQQEILNDLDWNKVHLFMIDERKVPIDSDESNFKLVYEGLFRELVAQGKMPEENLHPYHWSDIHEESALEEYNDEFAKVGGKFDFVILSAGEDGHTASLFPGHDSVKDTSKGFIQVEDAPKNPPHRISASRTLLESSDTGILLFFGESKREALAKFKDESVSIEECPAKVVENMREGFVFSDQH